MNLNTIPKNFASIIGARYTLVTGPKYTYMNIGIENHLGTITFLNRTGQSVSGIWTNTKWRYNDSIPMKLVDEVRIRYEWYWKYNEVLTHEKYEKLLKVAAEMAEHLFIVKVRDRIALELKDVERTGTIKIRKPLKKVGLRTGLKAVLDYIEKEVNNENPVNSLDAK
jgi:hypothetical protein